MDADRISVTVEGQTYLFRQIRGRDYLFFLGRMGIFPKIKGGATKDEAKAALSSAIDGNERELTKRILCECSIKPKLTMEPLDPQPPGTISIPELSDAAWVAINEALSRGSGVSQEDASAMDPSQETAANS